MACLLAVHYFVAAKLDTIRKLKIIILHVLKHAKRMFGVSDYNIMLLEMNKRNILAFTRKVMPNEIANYGFTTIKTGFNFKNGVTSLLSCIVS